jgi:hypothetical protein
MMKSNGSMMGQEAAIGQGGNQNQAGKGRGTGRCGGGHRGRGG